MDKGCYINLVLILVEVMMSINTTRAQWWGNNYFYDQEEPSGPPRKSIALSEFCTSEPHTLPNDTIQCSSCENRCGYLTQAEPWSGTEGCSCDKFCLTNRDCCQDMETFCSAEYSQGTEILQKSPSHHGLDHFGCIYIPSIENKLMIDKCPDGSSCKYSYTLSDDANMFVPMYDPVRGITYASGYCAVCNNAKDVTPHYVDVTCTDTSYYYYDYYDYGVSHSDNDLSKMGENINSTDELREMANHTECYLSYESPSSGSNSQYKPCVRNVITKCKEDCQNKELISNCSSYQGYVTLFGQDYRNIHCALCSDVEANTDDTECKRKARNPGWIIPDYQIEHDVIAGRSSTSFSLTMVFDFNPRSGLTVGKHVIPDCPIGEQYVWDEDECRPIICPVGQILEANECIPEQSNLTVTITVEYKERLPVSKVDSFLQDLEQLRDTSRKSTDEILQNSNISDHNLDVHVDANVGNESMEVTKTMKCNCDFAKYRKNNGTVSDLRDLFMKAFEKDFLRYLISKRIKSKSIAMEFDHSLAWNGTWDMSDPGCVWLLYEKDEIALKNNTVIIVKTKKEYPVDLFRDVGDLMAICVENIANPEKVKSDLVDEVLGIITIICVVLSIICLLIRVVMQFVTKHFRSKPGKLQFNLVLALLFMYISLLLGPAFTKWDGLCEFVAILLAYAFLACFAWMNVIATDTWLTFRSTNAFSKVDEAETIWKYSLLAWGVPVVIMIFPISFNHSNIDDKFKPNFGGDRCWYTERYAMLIFFGIPIAISILLNTILYISTSYNLHKAFKTSIQPSKDKYHFSTYIRLFIIMGITWVFGFISAFSDSDVMDFIFVIFAGLQGLFLFISVVCNKRVLSGLREKYKTSKATSSSGSAGTKSSDLPGVSGINESMEKDFQKPTDSTI